MINEEVDIIQSSYLSGRPFKFLMVNDNNFHDVNVANLEKFHIDALSFLIQQVDFDVNYFLAISSQLRGLRLNNYTYESLSALHTLSKLKYFQFSGCVNNHEIPFCSFPELEEVDLVYHKKKCEQLFELSDSLRFLQLKCYKAKTGDVLGGLKKLDSLSLEQFSICDLGFLTGMSDLRKLSIAYNPKISSIKNIGSVNKTLKSFGVRNCKNILDWFELEKMAKLEFLYLENCGEIESLSFLDKLPNLKSLWIIGTTSVRDGKLKAIIEREKIEKVNIVIQKHYDISKDDVRRFDFVPFPVIR